MNKINLLIDRELEQLYEQNLKEKERFELLFLTLRGSTIQYASRKTKSNKNKITVLEKKLNYLTRKIDYIPTFLIDSNQEQIKLIKKEIEEINNNKTRGSMVRSKARWENLAEKPTEYFCNLEKRNYVNKTIYRLQLENGEITTDQKRILREQEKFYCTLYTSKGGVDSEYVKDLNCPQISIEEKLILDAPITCDEITNALKEFL